MLLLIGVGLVGAAFVLIMLIKLLVKAAIFAVVLAVLYLVVAPKLGLPGATSLYQQTQHKASTVNKQQLLDRAARKAAENKTLRSMLRKTLASAFASPPGP
jgi:uncharacterized protein HemX